VIFLLVRFMLWSCLTISWLTIFFIPKQKVKKYSPAAILAALLVTIVYELSYYFGWWKIKRSIFPWMKVTDLSFVLGPFLIGTIWVFHLTYRFGFIVYTFVNILLDAFFSFVFLPFLEKVNIVKLQNISRFGIYGLMLLISLIIFPYQKWQEKGSFNKMGH